MDIAQAYVVTGRLRDDVMVCMYVICVYIKVYICMYVWVYIAERNQE